MAMAKRAHVALLLLLAAAANAAAGTAGPRRQGARVSDSVARGVGGAGRAAGADGDAAIAVASIRRRGTLAALHQSTFLAVASASMVMFAPLPSLTRHLASSYASSPSSPQARAVRILAALSAASAAAELLLSPLLGSLIDSLGRRRPAAFLHASLACANLAVVLRPGVWTVCLSRTTSVLAGGFLVVIANSIIADSCAQGGVGGGGSDAMGSVMGRQAACYSSGFLLGAMAGGRLLERGERAAYGAALALSVLSTLNVLLRMGESLGPAENDDATTEATSSAKSWDLTALRDGLLEAPLSSLRLLFGYGPRMRALAVLLMLQSAPAFIGDVFQVFTREEWGWQPMDLANFVALFGVIGVFSNTSLPFVLRLFGIRKFALFAVASSLFQPLAIVFADSCRPALIAACLGLYGITQTVGTSAAMTSLAADLGVPQGRLQGDNASALAVLKIVSPLLYGWLYLKGKSWAGHKESGATSGLEDLIARMGRRLPFVLNVILGICAFAVTFRYM